MKTARWIVYLLLLAAVPVTAGTLEGQGTADATAVLYFAGTQVTGTLDGTFTLTGRLVLDDEPIPFTAAGWTTGEGEGDTATLDVKAWATFAVRGTTEDGQSLVVQGGLTLSSLTADATGTAGSGSGTFFATVFLDGQQYHAQGSAEGSASGGFVPPEDPYSMELKGHGSFTLIGTLALVAADDEQADEPDSTFEQAQASLAAELPWDEGAWPEALMAQLLQLLAQVEEPDEEE